MSSSKIESRGTGNRIRIAKVLWVGQDNKLCFDVGFNNTSRPSSASVVSPKRNPMGSNEYFEKYFSGESAFGHVM
jgi:hypothetical protein